MSKRYYYSVLLRNGFTPPAILRPLAPERMLTGLVTQRRLRLLSKLFALSNVCCHSEDSDYSCRSIRRGYVLPHSGSLIRRKPQCIG